MTVLFPELSQGSEPCLLRRLVFSSDVSVAQFMILLLQMNIPLKLFNRIHYIFLYRFAMITTTRIKISILPEIFREDIFRFY